MINADRDQIRHHISELNYFIFPIAQLNSLLFITMFNVKRELCSKFPPQRWQSVVAAVSGSHQVSRLPQRQGVRLMVMIIYRAVIEQLWNRTKYPAFSHQLLVLLFVWWRRRSFVVIFHRAQWIPAQHWTVECREGGREGVGNIPSCQCSAVWSWTDMTA